MSEELRGYGETVVTPELRATLPFLTEKNVYQGKEQSWALTGLVAKDDADTLAFFEKLLCDYYEVDSIDDIPIHPFVNGKSGEMNDGDDEAFEQYTGYKGHVFFKATTNQQSFFECLGTEVEMDGSPVEDTGMVNPETGKSIRPADPSEFHAGCFVMMAINCKEYEEGKVKFYLQGVMKTGRGEIWAMGKGAAKSLLGLTSAKLTPGAAASNGEAKEAAQKALTAPVKKKSAFAAAAAPVKKTTRAQAAEEADDQEEEAEEEAETAPVKKRGRPAKSAGSAFNPPPLRKETIAKQAAQEAEEEDEDETDDTPTPPSRKPAVPARKAGKGGLSALLQRPSV